MGVVFLGCLMLMVEGREATKLECSMYQPSAILDISTYRGAMNDLGPREVKMVGVPSAIHGMVIVNALFSPRSCSL